jgi:hypothetical protein
MVTIIKNSISKKLLQNRVSRIKLRRRLNAYKYCGVMKICKNPVSIQNEMRNEWN